jgi:hypothetical protein
MIISPANNPMPSRPIEPKAPKTVNFEPATPAANSTVLNRTADLLSESGMSAANRPEVVARGRALAADANYPTPEVINKLAGLIVG